MGFVIAEKVEEYGMQAAEFEPTRLALDSMTPTGVRVQVEGDFRMDASKVPKGSVRNLGRFGTWIGREVKSGPTEVRVYVPAYGNILIGTAKVPGIKVNIRNGHTTHVSFVTDLLPGEFDGIRNIAHDWIDGRLGSLQLQGKAAVSLRSGLLSLGEQNIEKNIVLKG